MLRRQRLPTYMHRPCQFGPALVASADFCRNRGREGFQRACECRATGKCEITDEIELSAIDFYLFGVVPRPVWRKAKADAQILRRTCDNLT
ncbi:hypothetical protein [Rhizobium herbae]|uniref:Uncharacterized protein n=1 Tax=Rhizobium herbae TaxID=508661 RepID=A0ABS4EV45_9HYPH|nr:hypothetical protein [Rhizobium herbae]MBP1861818.1 hypothetical protein [Rhizobium herbae]